MPTRLLIRGDPIQLSLWVARLVTTRGLGIYCPQSMLTIFMYTKFKSVRYVLSDYVSLWAKIAYLHLVYSFCTLYFYECKQTVIIHNRSSVSNFSVSIFFDSVSVILSNLLLVELCSLSCTFSPLQVLVEEYQMWGLAVVVSSMCTWSHLKSKMSGSFVSL